MKIHFLAVSFFFCQLLVAQLPDSSLSQRVHFSSLSHSHEYAFDDAHFASLHPHRLFFPLAAISYGMISLHNPELKGFNEQAKTEIKEHNDQFSVHLDNYLQFAPAFSVYALNAAGVKTTHNFRDRTILLALSTLIMAGTVAGLKQVTHQLRPDGSAFNSFPSGHTATAFSGAAFMRQELKHQSPLLSYSGYLMAGTTGVLRMYNNRHWLGDVIAGAGIGMLSTRMSYWLFEKVNHPHQKAIIHL